MSQKNSSTTMSYSNKLVYEVENTFDEDDSVTPKSSSNGGDVINDDMIVKTMPSDSPTKARISRLKSEQPILSLAINSTTTTAAAVNSNIMTKSLNLSGSPSSLNAPSFFNTNFDENGYVFDGIKIEIDDIENNSLSNLNTTQSLKRCKSQVLRLYYTLLCFIGWRPFYKSFYRIPLSCSALNIIYPILIVTFLFYSYVYDAMTCQGKLNVAVDFQSVTPLSIITAIKNNITTVATSTLSPSSGDPVASNSTKAHNFFGSLFSKHPQQDVLVPSEETPKCGHVVTTYILPSLMHFVSYILGFIYFRINENEQLYALMEKVFLAVNQSLKIVSQDRVIKRLKIFFFLGLSWVMLAMALQILFRAAYGFETKPFHPSWLFVILQSIALIIMNSVYLAVVINHATQCELIIFYTHEIKTRLEEKSIALKDAMQQILDIRMAIANLNSTVSKMTTLVALTFLEKFIIGLIILIMNQVLTPLAWTYRALFPFSWLLILAFTLFQVSRLNSKCSKLKQIALSARVYGYHNCNREELDSFLLFVSNTNLRAKLFGIPMKPSYLLGSFLVVSFVIIIIIQTSLITSPNSFL